jgi:hypothetical protein
MVEQLRCARCDSDEMMPRVRVVERGDDGLRHDVQIEVQRRPNAVFLKRAQRNDLSARVCGACGYVELYVDAPGALYAAYLQADASPAVSAMEELERTREALAESQIRLGELEEKLAFVEQLLERDEPPKRLPKGSS